MFSRDVKHYRPTPRTINQAFGPYHSFSPRAYRRTQAHVYMAALGVLALGIWYGWMVYAGVA